MANIWNLLNAKDKKFFIFLLLFSIIVLLLEIITIGSIFPIIYSISDKSFYQNFPLFKKIEIYFEYNSYNFSILILFTLFIVILFKNALLTIFHWFETKFIFETQEAVSKNLFYNLLNKDYSFYLENNSADLITRIRTDSNLIRETITALLSLLQSLIFVFGILCFLIVIEPFGFMITASIFLIFGSIFYYFSSKKSSKLGESRQREEIQRTQKLQESFGGIKEIKTFLKKDVFINDYENLVKRIAKTYFLRGFILKLPRVFLETLIVLVVIVFMILLINKSFDDLKILALIGVFAVSALKILPHLNSILNSLNVFKFSAIPINYYRKNILPKSNNKNKIEKEVPIHFNQDISYKNVSFKYPNKEEFILKNINLKINKGDRVLVGGVTGSGKSTLIDLILGLQKPISGKILIDGQTFRSENFNWLKKIGYVPQSIYLFDDTIKNNVIMGTEDEEFDEKSFDDCLRTAEIFNFIQSLPNKENTLIGEKGSKLSGGQKQRIGIARALYKNPEIIIFDEATNALDKNTELKVFENVNKYLDKTFIFINHREVEYGFKAKKIFINNKMLSFNE